MDRQSVLDPQGRSKGQLQARFGVTRLALFGSTVRNAASNGSIMRGEASEFLARIKALPREVQQ